MSWRCSSQHKFLIFPIIESKSVQMYTHSCFCCSSLFYHPQQGVKNVSQWSVNILTLPHQHLNYTQGREKAKWKQRIRFHLLHAHQQISRRGPCSVELALLGLILSHSLSVKLILNRVSTDRVIHLNRVLSVATNYCSLYLRCRHYVMSEEPVTLTLM